MKKKKRNKNLINVLSFLNEATIELKNKIENLLKNKLDLRKLEELYDAISSLKEGEITQELLLLLNSKSGEINKILDTKKIILIPYYKDKKEKFAQIKQKFDFLLNAAKDAAEHQKTIAQEAEERKPFDDYWKKVFKVYRDGIEELEGKIQELELKKKKTDSLENFKESLKTERTTATRKEAFNAFINNLKNSKNISAISSYEESKEQGQKYQEYLNAQIEDLKKDISRRIEDVKKSAEKAIEIPEIRPTKQIPLMQQLPQEEPSTSPTSILGQIGSGLKKGFQGFKTAVGLEEEVLKQESLQESLKLKKLSLKEAMEKEYD